jgi:GntR family transcriptional regulator
LVREARSRIARATNTVTIGGADPEVAEYLRVPLNAPTAEVRCVVTDRQGVALYVAEMVYRGDCARLDIDLLRG